MSVVKLIKRAFLALVLASATAAILAGPTASAGTPFKKASQALSASITVQAFQQKNKRLRLAQSAGRRISPSAALRAAVRSWPGSKGLGVRYLQGRRGYVVTLKTRGRVHRVFVDGRTGRVGR